ncbi:MAG: hypothetical protein WCO55_02570 [Candidatus Falkowbacteria bacterium]
MIDMGYLDNTSKKFLDLDQIPEPQSWPNYADCSLYAGRIDEKRIYLQICQNEDDFQILAKTGKAWYTGKKLVP